MMDHDVNQEETRSPHERRRIDVKSLRAAFRKFESSKTHVIKRIRELREEAETNREAREELDGADNRAKELEDEVAALQAELDAATTLLDEIDETIG
jgi:phage shock protein A